MALKFATCYPLTGNGEKIPCASVWQTEDGSLVELLGPGIAEDVWRALVSKWNETNCSELGQTDRIDRLEAFVTAELSRWI